MQTGHFSAAQILRATFAVAVVSFSLVPSPAEAQDSEISVEGLSFQEPFSGLSASDIESKLVVFLITDEDAFQWSKSKLKKADKRRLIGGVDVWCGADFRRAFTKLFTTRPDLKDRCIVQTIVAGLPAEVVGGRARTLPKRAVTVICDGRYRLLGFSVGVPDQNDLLRLIEDAEETQTLLSLHDDAPAKLGDQIMARSTERVRRIYSESLKSLQEQYPWDETLYRIDEPWIRKHARLINDLNPSFLFDAKLRFGLTDATDRLRLVVLEQHCETRRDWCDSIAPFIAGRPMRDLMNPLLDTTWGIPVVLDQDPADHQELLRWFKTQHDIATIVLAIHPTELDRDNSWPPLDISGRKVVKRNWKDLETVMSEHAFRTVTVEELAVIIREHDIQAIDLFAPSRGRYVFIEPGKNKAWVIRETDVPGKFIQRLEKK